MIRAAMSGSSGGWCGTKLTAAVVSATRVAFASGPDHGIASPMNCSKTPWLPPLGAGA